MYVAQLAIKFGDSKGQTVRTRTISAFSQIFRVILVFIAFISHSLTIDTFIAIGYIVSFIASLSVTVYFFRKRNIFFSSLRIDMKKVKADMKYFYNYCHPLVVFALVGLLTVYFDRWFLQYIDGSTEQGYFSLGFRFSSILLIFCNSLLPIFWRETAHAHHKNDDQGLTSYFKKTFSFVFLASSFVAIFFAINAGRIVMLAGGDAFKGAVIPLAILSILPIYNAVTQISTTFFLATERTKLHRNISITQQLAGLAVTYFLLAPHSAVIPGFNMKSAGLAIKMLLVILIMSNVRVFYVSRIIKVGYRYFLKFQMYTLAYFCFFAILTGHASSWLLSKFGTPPHLVYLLVHGAMYFFTAVLLILLKPNFFGITNSDLSKIKDFFMKRI